MNVIMQKNIKKIICTVLLLTASLLVANIAKAEEGDYLWSERQPENIPETLSPKSGQPAMEFTGENYDEFFFARNIVVDTIPDSVDFIANKKVLSSYSVGPAALFVPEEDKDSSNLHIYILYPNLGKYVIPAHSPARVSLYAVLDRDGNNILGDDLANIYQLAPNDKRYSDPAGEFMLGGYELGFDGGAIKDLSAVKGMVQFILPQNVSVVDFVTTETKKTKSANNLEGDVTLASVSDSKIEIVYDIPSQNILDVLLYDAKGKKVNADSLVIGESRAELSFLNPADVAFIRLVVAEKYDQRSYPFELRM